MLIAVIPSASTVETLLSNLSEADFDLRQVSVVMLDLKVRTAIAKDSGPLKGATLKNIASRLAKAGLPEPDAKPYVDAVAGGLVLVAIAPPPESEEAAREMLQDHSAQLIRGLPEHAGA